MAAEPAVHGENCRDDEKVAAEKSCLCHGCWAVRHQGTTSNTAGVHTGGGSGRPVCNSAWRAVYMHLLEVWTRIVH